MLSDRAKHQSIQSFYPDRQHGFMPYVLMVVVVEIKGNRKVFLFFGSEL
jgi:hypothetical protein